MFLASAFSTIEAERWKLGHKNDCADNNENSSKPLMPAHLFALTHSGNDHYENDAELVYRGNF